MYIRTVTTIIIKSASSDDRARACAHVLAKFEVVTITSVGCIQSYVRCGNKVWMSGSIHICTQSGQSPEQAPEVWWRSDNVCTSYKWLWVLWRAVVGRESLRVCHGHTLQTLEKILPNFNPPWLKSNLTKFKTVTIKSVGEVWSYASCGNRQTGTNLHLPLKMAEFLWTRHHDVPGFFVRLGMTKACTEFRQATQN